MIDLDQLQEELDFLERDGLSIIELFTNVVYSMLCELKVAREVVRLARELHCREAMDMDVEGHDALDEAIEKYDEACHGTV